MKVKIEYSTGNFTLAIVGNVDGAGNPGEPLATIITSGIRYVTERDVASECYKSIAGKGGKLPKGFKRDTLAFTPERATQFQTVAQAALAKLMPDVAVEVSENVGTAKADALALLELRESKPDFALWLEKNIGFTGETHGDDGEWTSEVVTAVAVRIKAVKDAQKAAQEAALNAI